MIFQPTDFGSSKNHHKIPRIKKYYSFLLEKSLILCHNNLLLWYLHKKIILLWYDLIIGIHLKLTLELWFLYFSYTRALITNLATKWTVLYIFSHTYERFCVRSTVYSLHKCHSVLPLIIEFCWELSQTQDKQTPDTINPILANPKHDKPYIISIKDNKS